MNTRSVVIAGTTGTTFMTIFSYLVSETKDKNHKEPDLLGKLVQDLTPKLKEKYSAAAGWTIHYITGLVFAACLINEWEKDGHKATLISGLVLGALSGVAGAAIWKMIFQSHPAPPSIDYKSYYKHLVLAHAVFGVFTAIGYNLTKNKNK